jgi:hypothetical protein
MIRTLCWLVVVFFCAVPVVAFAEDKPAPVNPVTQYELVGFTLAPDMVEGIAPNRLNMSYKDEPKRGVLVLEVLKNTQADKIGFKPRDIIFRFDGDEIDSLDQLIEDMIETKIAGAPVRVLRKNPKTGKDMVVDLSFQVGDHYVNRVNLLLFNYSRTRYFKHYDVLFFVWQYKRSRNCQYTHFIPILYQYRRVSTRTTHRLFWFLDIQTGSVPDSVDV